MECGLDAMASLYLLSCVALRNPNPVHLLFVAHRPSLASIKLSYNQFAAGGRHIQ